MGIVGNIAVVFCIILAVLGITFFIKTKEPSNNSYHFFAVPSIILAVFALCTSWMWLYYFCLYVSLPALFLSMISGYMAYRINASNKIIRVIIGLQIIAVILSILGALFFNII